LVATPGRLLDLHGQGLLYLGAVQYLILDEADRMLDMGFVRDVKKIVAEVPRRKQTLLFSATMAPEIRSLAADLLRNPLEVAVTPAARTADRIDQFVFHIAKSDKRILLERFLRDPAVERCVVFTRTKHGADKVARGLDQIGVSAAAIHGNRSQSQRVRALDGFKSGEVRVLVATDIAARGLDIDGVSHVINFELPNEPDSYVHRIGRTARNGATGIAMAMCDQEEVSLLRDIEKRIGQAIPVAEIAGLTLPTPAGRAQPQAAQPRQQPRHGQNARGGQSQGRGGPQQSRGGQPESQRDGQRGAPQRGYQQQAPSQPQARPSQPQARPSQPQAAWGQPQAQAGQPQARPDRGFPQGQRTDRGSERPVGIPGGDNGPRRRDRQRLPDMAAKPAQNDLHAPVNRDWY
jgi:ATP-dependent RNA helicase RhlE